MCLRGIGGHNLDFRGHYVVGVVVAGFRTVLHVDGLHEAATVVVLHCAGDVDRELQHGMLEEFLAKLRILCHLQLSL